MIKVSVLYPNADDAQHDGHVEHADDAQQWVKYAV